MNSTGSTTRPEADAPRTSLRATRKEEALWMLETLSPGTAANNLSLAFRVAGRLDARVLGTVLDALADRYASLRTVFTADGAALRKTVLAPGSFTVPVEDITPAVPGPGSGDAAPGSETGHAAPGPAPAAVTPGPAPADATPAFVPPADAGPTADGAASATTVEKDLAAFAARHFPLTGGPLLRAAVLRGPDGDAFCLAVHHLVFDTVSSTILLEELVSLYDAALAGRPLPEPLLQAAPAYTEPEPADESVAYWHRQLAGFDRTALELDLGHADVDDPTLLGDQLTRELSAEARDVVRRLQKDLRAPEAVILLAAYSLLLVSHGAGPDLVVGSPVNVRPPEHSRAVGYHVNVLPLRTGYAPELTFRELVLKVRDQFFGGLMHSGVPVDALSDVAPAAGSSWRNVLFRHVFNYVPDIGDGGFRLAGAPAQLLVVENGYSKFDLEFFVMPAAGGIRIRTVYRTEILTAADVAALLARYEALLESLAGQVDKAVGEISVWSGQDRAVITAANTTAAPVRPATVLEGFRDHVRATPDAVAILDGERSVGYRQLWDSAVAVREELRAAGTAPGDVVAVALPRGAELVAAVLGTWLAGALYLPIDPDHPAHRIGYQLTDSGAGVLIAAPGRTDLEGEGRRLLQPPPLAAPDAPRDAAPDPVPVGPDDRAYLMYTSGSTGRPKGTLVTHGSLGNLAAHFGEELNVGPGDTGLWLTTFSFDISGLELFVPLYRGGRVVAAPDAARTDGAVLRELVERHGAGIVEATPTTWRAVLPDVRDALRGLRVLCGGEPLPRALARELIATGCVLHHVYGPTETTIWSTSTVLTEVAGPRPGVGRPIRNTQVMVVAPDGRELPVGVRGELCIAGAGVAVGYHNRAALTGERFGEHPVHGRFYRTGDVAQWQDDGTLVLLGRGDRQVKLRGNRIELPEIEAVLLAHPEVKAAAVVLVDAAGPDAALAAFVQAADTPGLVDSLWEHARAELPRAVVPQEFTVVDALPTTLNDKVDYPALLRLAEERRAGGGAPGGPAAAEETGLEGLLIALWRELLERDDVTADSNFFINGGHSLMGAVLVQRLEPLTGVTLPLADLFSDPTPRRLAARLRAAGATDGPTPTHMNEGDTV